MPEFFIPLFAASMISGFAHTSKNWQPAFEYIVTNFSTSCASSFPAPQTSLKQFLFSNKSFSINYSFACISNTKFMILKHTLLFTSKF